MNRKIADVLDLLAVGMHTLTDARDDARYIEGLEGIVAYENIDSVVSLLVMTMNKLEEWELEHRAANEDLH